MMSINLEGKILSEIKKAKRGSLFFTEDFSLLGNHDAIRKALERLVKSNEIERLAPGIYFRPEISDLLGKLTPSIEKIAFAIAKRDKAKIVPTGAYALNRLGLSTQVPTNIVYLTDGSARKINIGSQSITFKKASPKSVASIGEISTLVIQSLKTIGKNKVNDGEIKHVQKLLEKENPHHLEHDISIAPVWIKEIMIPVFKKITNEK